MEERLKNSLNISEINSMFQFFDKIIDKALNQDDPDDLLIKSFFWFREHIKERTGTSNGINKISEVLYFQYIKKYIENNFKPRLKPRPKFELKRVKRSKTYYFEAEVKGKESTISLTSGTTCKVLGINLLPPNLSNKEKKAYPDIVISIKQVDEEGEKYNPIAIFEIKNLLKGNQLSKEVSRFTHFKTQLKDEPYLILICLHYEGYNDQDFDQFKEISEKKCKLIRNQYRWGGGGKRKEEYFENKIKGFDDNKGSIKAIMEDIINSIEKYQE